MVKPAPSHREIAPTPDCRHPLSSLLQPLHQQIHPSNQKNYEQSDHIFPIVLYHGRSPPRLPTPPSQQPPDPASHIRFIQNTSNVRLIRNSFHSYLIQNTFNSKHMPASFSLWAVHTFSDPAHFWYPRGELCGMVSPAPPRHEVAPPPDCRRRPSQPRHPPLYPTLV